MLLQQSVRPASRVGMLCFIFRAGYRLHHSSMVYQCSLFTTTVDSFSFLVLGSVLHAYPVFVIHSLFPRKVQNMINFFAFLLF